MKDIDYGHVEIKLKEIMESQDISINKLACRAEMQRTQLKKYINNNVQRVNTRSSVPMLLSRLRSE